jgi:hypothetical protein
MEAIISGHFVWNTLLNICASTGVVNVQIYIFICISDLPRLTRHVALLFNGVNATSYINVNLPFAGLTGRLNHIQK